MTRTTSAFRPGLLALLGAGACVACCALPVAAGIIGAGVLGTAAVALEWLGLGLLAAAAVVFAVARLRRRSSPACAVDGGCGCGPGLAGRARDLGCTLPDAEVPGRGEAFAALFRRGLRDRTVGPHRAVWTFAWSAELERDARALAAAEQGCCSFWRFDIQRVGDELRWEAQVPADRAPAIAMLDAIAGSAQHPA
jgi:mercuric ion transport protein